MAGTIRFEEMGHHIIVREREREIRLYILFTLGGSILLHFDYDIRG